MKKTYTKIINRLRSESEAQPSVTKVPSWSEVLSSVSGVSRSAEERAAMTISCRDSDYIPKVKNAGSISQMDGKTYQLMHNGLLVEEGGYFGDWMANIITQLKGHHEPQEEKVFYEILKRIPAGGTMIELGSYWAYYSMWFNKAIENSTNYCCEPDPVNRDLGQRNAAKNNCQNMEFILSAAGKDDGAFIDFTPQEGEDREDVHVAIRSVDGLVNEKKIKRIDMLHMDIQGVELDALEGAEQAIRDGKVRFIMISTHHHLISGDPLIHEKCLEKIKSLGGRIITEHAIHESFSGDGLIAASFFKEDNNLTIEVSENRLSTNLFRPYNEDIAILAKAYEELRKS